MAVGGGVGRLALDAGTGDVALCPIDARDDDDASALAALSGICPLTLGEETACGASAWRMKG